SDLAMITFSMEADGFLRYMVRTVLGTLVDVGRGRIDSNGFFRILEAKDRSEAGVTAPPQGLFLKDVYY
ncbi:MAG: tRNA pseudouridine(38-40) synthase TruA, partial [Deltaproteobacteria bacterium]|nr:tRNA pseudouridine(38-40) synthase TruA [Deltaproteobacteria bacterium]